MATLGWKEGYEGVGLFGWLGSNLFIYLFRYLVAYFALVLLII